MKNKNQNDKIIQLENKNLGNSQDEKYNEMKDSYQVSSWYAKKKLKMLVKFVKIVT